MAITYHEQRKIFHLQTQNSSYQMQVGDYGVLLHLYYGRNVGDSLITQNITLRDTSFSGNPNEAGYDRTFSLDILPQEYTGSGNGDYRIHSLEIENADGSNAVDLRYHSHKIYSGKYALEGLPAVFAKETEAETLEIILMDRVSKAEVTLLYGVLNESDVITRAVKVRNAGEAAFSLTKVMSAALDFQEGNKEWIQLYGQHALERQTERRALHHGIQSIGSVRGESSHHYNPFFILCDPETTEDSGDCYGILFVYSGNFLAELELGQREQARVTMGIHPEHFCYRLEAGEVFTAPEAVLIYSIGLTSLSKRYHDLYREHLCRSPYIKKRRPVLVNNWEATYFDFNEEKLFEIARAAKDIGIEMLVMDDGWFGKRENDRSGLGDWVVNEDKLKGGLGKLVQRVTDIGLKFGIWLEPEMVSEDSDLYRAHPDWCMSIPGRAANRSRYQLNLDITRADVRDYIMNQIFDVLDHADISYVKWDMNRSLSNVYSRQLPPGKQGEVYHRYVLGLYDMLERLIGRYPELLLETCSGGGGRFDAGMLYYSPQIWCSDNTDAFDRLKIQYGTSFAYPVSAVGAHVSASPNHQNGNRTSFRTRAVTAMAGTFGYELDLTKLSDEEKRIAGEQIEVYKRIAPLLLEGDYYRLSDPFKNIYYTAWEIVSKDRKKAVVSIVLTKPEIIPNMHILKLKGLDAGKTYKLQGFTDVFTGAALMYAGILLPWERLPDAAYQWIIDEA